MGPRSVYIQTFFRGFEQFFCPSNRAGHIFPTVPTFRAFLLGCTHWNYQLYRRLLCLLQALPTTIIHTSISTKAQAPHTHWTALTVPIGKLWLALTQWAKCCGAQPRTIVQTTTQYLLYRKDLLGPIPQPTRGGH